MADFTFNIAKGRVIEFYNRVKSNDPANSALLLVPVLAAGLETDAVLKDKDTLADVFSGATDEATAGGWNRKTLTDAQLAAFPAPNDAGDAFNIDLDDQSWSTVTAGNDVGKLLLCYDNDTTLGTDANVVPLCAYDFTYVTDGSTLQAIFNAAGVFSAA